MLYITKDTLIKKHFSMINARTVTTNDCIDSRGIIITTKRNNKNNHALTEGITTYETLRDLDISFPFGNFQFLEESISNAL